MKVCTTESITMVDKFKDGVIDQAKIKQRLGVPEVGYCNLISDSLDVRNTNSYKIFQCSICMQEF